MLNSLTRFRIAQILLSSFVLIASAALFAAISFVHIDKQTDFAIRQFASSVDNQIKLVLNRNTEAIEALARQPRIINLLTNPNPDKKLELENEFIGFFQHASDFRVIEAGQKHTKTNAGTISFADLAMINASENNPTPPAAAAIAYGTDHAHITMIHRVIGDDGKTVIGNIMVQFTPALISQIISDVTVPQGYAEIRQPKSNGQFITLAGTGNSAAKQNPAASVFSIEGTRWQLAYWAEPGIGGLPKELLIGFLLTAVIALAVLVIGVVFLHRSLSNHVKDDLALLVTLCRNGLKTKIADNYPNKLTETKPSLAELKNLLVAHQVKTADKTRGGNDKNTPSIEIDDPSRQ